MSKLKNLQPSVIDDLSPVRNPASPLPGPNTDPKPTPSDPPAIQAQPSPNAAPRPLKRKTKGNGSPQLRRKPKKG